MRNAWLASEIAARVALLKGGAIDTMAGPREFRAAQMAEPPSFLAGLEVQ